MGAAMLNKRLSGGATRNIHYHPGSDNAQISSSCPSMVTHILNNWLIKHSPNIHSFNRHNHIQSPTNMPRSGSVIYFPPSITKTFNIIALEVGTSSTAVVWFVSSCALGLKSRWIDSESHPLVTGTTH